MLGVDELDPFGQKRWHPQWVMMIDLPGEGGKTAPLCSYLDGDNFDRAHDPPLVLAERRSSSSWAICV